MTKQFESAPSQEKISSLYNKITKEPKELILQPYFQRRLVWNDYHKSKFIDTLLKGYPIPEIYISQSGIDISEITVEDYVIDGQQRLSTIIEYINGNEKFSTKFGIPSYRELNQEDKRDFLSYKLIVRDIGSVSQEDLREIFSRINSTNYGLNAIEINNAIYDGEYMNFAKEFAKQTDFGDNLNFLSDTAISRMEDLDYVLLIMTTILESGYFSRSKEIENYIQKFDNNFEEKDFLMALMIKVFNLIQDFHFEDDSIWTRKSNYYTLFCEIAFFEQENPNVIERHVGAIRDKILEFEKLVLENKKNTNSQYGQYYAAMYTGTNNRTSRVLRGKSLSDLLRNYM